MAGGGDWKGALARLIRVGDGLGQPFGKDVESFRTMIPGAITVPDDQGDLRASAAA